MGSTTGEVMKDTDGKIIVVFERSTSTGYSGGALASVTFIPLLYRSGSNLKGDVPYVASVTANGKSIVGTANLQLNGTKE